MSSMRFKPGTIYILRCEDYMKIGFTTNDPRLRLSTIQSGNPFSVRIVRTIPGYMPQETWMHARYAKLRLPNSEWFLYTEDVLTVEPKDMNTLFKEADEALMIWRESHSEKREKRRKARAASPGEMPTLDI